MRTALPAGARRAGRLPRTAAGRRSRGRGGQGRPTTPRSAGLERGLRGGRSGGQRLTAGGAPGVRRGRGAEPGGVDRAGGLGLQSAGPSTGPFLTASGCGRGLCGGPRPGNWAPRPQFLFSSFCGKRCRLRNCWVLPELARCNIRLA